MEEEGKATQHQGKSEEACRELRIHRLAADADADRLAADDRVSLQKSLQAENLGRGGKCRLSFAQGDSFGFVCTSKTFFGINFKSLRVKCGRIKTKRG